MKKKRTLLTLRTYSIYRMDVKIIQCRCGEGSGGTYGAFALLSFYGRAAQFAGSQNSFPIDQPQFSIGSDMKFEGTKHTSLSE